MHMVTCQECQKQMKMITNSHLKSHQLTPAAYCLKYPDSKLLSDEVSQKYSKNAKQQNAKRDYSGVGKKISATKKLRGTIPWNKGIPITQEQRDRQSITLREGYASGRLKGRSGIQVLRETKEKISESLKLSYANSELKVRRDVARSEKERSLVETRELEFSRKLDMIISTLSVT